MKARATPKHAGTGRPRLGEQARQSVAFTLPPELVGALRVEARRRRVSASQLLAQLMAAWVGQGCPALPALPAREVAAGPRLPLSAEELGAALG